MTLPASRRTRLPKERKGGKACEACRWEIIFRKRDEGALREIKGCSGRREKILEDARDAAER